MGYRAAVETVRDEELLPLNCRPERTYLDVLLCAALRAPLKVRVTRQFRVRVSRNLVNVSDFFVHITPFLASLVSPSFA